MTDEELLPDLSVTWEEGFELGQDHTAEELCKVRPEWALRLQTALGR